MDIDQLEQAVSLALQSGADPAVKQQALEFCNSVRDAADGWRPALAIVVDERPRLPEAVFFAFQVLDAALPRLGQQELDENRQQLWTYLEWVLAQQEPVTPAIRNKLAQTLAYLFVLLYQTSWQSFFHDLQALSAANPRATDMYMRILKVVNEEIGDPLIPRDAETTQRNNLLKDQIRANDMANLIQSWMAVLEQHSASTDNLSQEIVGGVLTVIGGWVSWVDISQLVGQGAVPLIFKTFTNQNGINMIAADTTGEIVAKKMPPGAKLELLQLLNLPQLLRELPKNTDDIDFDERLARMVNTAGSELGRIMDSSASTPAVADQAEQYFIELMPHILDFLGNEYDDTAIQVVPCIGDYLQFMRKAERKNQGKPSDTRRQLLQVLQRKVMEKSGYDGDSSWSASQDDESDAEFQQLRDKLRVIQEQIASIDLDLFLDELGAFVQPLLAMPDPRWQKTELALYEISVLGVVIKTNRAARDVERPRQVLDQLLRAMILSDVVQINHGSVQLWYMELVYRNVSIFNSDNRDILARALQGFVSPLGVHNPSLAVRLRSWYLFFKVLKAVRKLLGDSVAGDVLPSVLPLLEIKVTPLDDDDEENEADTIFNAQLYLFELCGMLSAGPHATADAAKLLQSLYADVQNAVAAAQKGGDSKEVEVARRRAHHDLMALGTFARGMSDSVDPAGTGGGAAELGEAMTAEMQQASQVVVAVVDGLSSVPLVLEAGRFAISRLVSLLGSRILMEISRLIGSLLTASRSPSEVVDFLSFLGQLVHVFRTDGGVFEMFTELITPLLQQVFASLQDAEQEASSGSTDAVLACRELVRTYLAFIFNLLNNRYGALFLVDRNRAVFDTVVESLLHYAQASTSDVANQKQAIAALSKMTQLWGTGRVGADNFGAGEPVPLFQTDFMYSKMTELCWTLASKPGFNLKDAETRLAVLELGGLQKTCLEVGGDRYRELLFKYLLAAGMPQPMVEEFGAASNLSMRDFKRFFYDFLVRTA